MDEILQLNRKDIPSDRDQADEFTNGGIQLMK
jgi:hypothetical protein